MSDCSRTAEMARLPRGIRDTLRRALPGARRLLTVAVLAGLTMAGFASGATAAPWHSSGVSDVAHLAANAAESDDEPCGAVFVIPKLDPPGLEPNDVQNCPDWSPDGSIPVFAKAQSDSKIVGHINPAGDDWYLCEVLGGRHELGKFKTNWWAFTKADGNGRFGYVPQTYFRGGGNFVSDAGLNDRCLGF